MEVILGGHSILDDLFEDGITVGSSKLYRTLRVEKNLLYDVAAKSYSGSQVGYFGVRGIASPANFPEAFKRTHKVLFDFPSTVESSELYRAKKLLNTVYAKKVRDTSALAYMMGLPALILDIVEQPYQMLEKINEVTLKDIKRVAGELLNPEEARLAVLGPYPKNSRIIKNLL